MATNAVDSELRLLLVSDNHLHARKERMCNLHLRFSRYKFVFSDTQNKAAKRENIMENWAGGKNGERCWVHGGGKEGRRRENLYREGESLEKKGNMGEDTTFYA